MAVEPELQRTGIGSAVMAEALRQLRETDADLVWASARDAAVPFYRRFGFEVIEGSGSTPAETGRPHHLIELDLRAPGSGDPHCRVIVRVSGPPTTCRFPSTNLTVTSTC